LRAGSSPLGEGAATPLAVLRTRARHRRIRSRQDGIFDSQPGAVRGVDSSDLRARRSTMEAAAFWVATAAVIIMVGWYKSKNDAEKHKTFRTIVEKTGVVDEAQLRLLFDTRPTSLGGPSRGAPGRFRVLAAIGMFVLICILIWMGWLSLAMFGTDLAPNPPLAGVLWSIFVCLLGIGFFLFAMRFVEKRSAESERQHVGSHEE
jgi:hypothetical protein